MNFAISEKLKSEQRSGLSRCLPALSFVEWKRQGNSKERVCRPLGEPS